MRVRATLDGTRPVSALTDVLERHVPYASSLRDEMLCLVCLNPTEDVGSRRCGEFATVADWAAHVQAEIRAAGLTVTRRATAAQVDAEALF